MLRKDLFSHNLDDKMDCEEERSVLPLTSQSGSQRDESRLEEELIAANQLLALSRTPDIVKPAVPLSINTEEVNQVCSRSSKGHEKHSYSGGELNYYSYQGEEDSQVEKIPPNKLEPVVFSTSASSNLHLGTLQQKQLKKDIIPFNYYNKDIPFNSPAKDILLSTEEDCQKANVSSDLSDIPKNSSDISEKYFSLGDSNCDNENNQNKLAVIDNASVNEDNSAGNIFTADYSSDTKEKGIEIEFNTTKEREVHKKSQNDNIFNPGSNSLKTEPDKSIVKYIKQETPADNLLKSEENIRINPEENTRSVRSSVTVRNKSKRASCRLIKKEEFFEEVSEALSTPSSGKKLNVQEQNSKRIATLKTAYSIVGPQDEDSSEDDPDKLYCLCQKPHNSRFMIQCDECAMWYHGACVKITKVQGLKMDKDNIPWICPKCDPPALKKNRKRPPGRKVS